MKLHEIIEKYYNEQKYYEAVKEIKKHKLTPVLLVFKDPYKMCNSWRTYEYSFFAASELHLYDNMIEFGDELLKFPHFKNNNYLNDCNQIAILERLLEANIYRLITCSDKNEKKINLIIKMLEQYYNKNNIAPTSFFKDLNCVYNNYLNGEVSFYELESYIPFHLPIESLKTKIEFIKNLKEIYVEKITRNKGTEYELYYTKIKLQFYGFICAKRDLCGPNIERFEKNYLLDKFSSVVNEFLLCVSIVDNYNYYPRVYSTYLQTFIATQMIDSNKNFTFSNHTDFGNGPIISNRKSTFSEEDINSLNMILNDSKFKLYKKLIILCKNDLSVGLFTEAFFLINSALESMVYYFATEITNKVNYKDEFNEFLEPTSICEKCEYRQAQDGERKANSTPPNLFNTIKFLRDKSLITSKKSKFLINLIKDIRCDHVRNDLIHGRLEIVEIEIVNESLNKLSTLERELENVFNKIK